jgi:hypothetical protein
VSLRRLLTRAVVLLAVAVVGSLAVVGGVSLHGAGVVAVALAGGVAGCLGAGVAREGSAGHRTVADAAWRAAVGTVTTLLVFAGSAAVAGGAAPVLVVVCLGLVALAWWARRAPRAARPAPPAPAAGTVPPPSAPHARRGPHPSGRGVPGADPFPAPVRPAATPPPAALPPAASMSVEELSREWRRTAVALETAGDPAARAQLVRRRGEVLDELERRDPGGFARWLAGGASAGDYPVRQRGDSATGPGPA